MKSKRIDQNIAFPLTVIFEDGTSSQYADISDLEMNLEDLDTTLDSGCTVTDSRGREVELTLKLLSLEVLAFKEQE